MTIEALALAQRPRHLATSRVAGGLILAMIILLALLGPWISGYDPRVQDLSRTLRPPGDGHLLGTDHLGRDVLSRLSHALRLSGGLALLSVLSSAALGVSLGLIAAWRRGVVERLIVGLADAVLSMPGLVLVLLMLALAPGHLWPVYIGLSLALWVEYFRVVRARTRILMTSPQIEASRLLGFGPLYLVRRHLWPELAPLVGTLMVFGAATSVLALAAIGFVGVGLRPPTAELGLMMSEWFPYYVDAPWLLAAPVITLIAIVLGLALLAGKGLSRD